MADPNKKPLEVTEAQPVTVTLDPAIAVLIMALFTEGRRRREEIFEYLQPSNFNGIVNAVLQFAYEDLTTYWKRADKNRDVRELGKAIMEGKTLTPVQQQFVAQAIKAGKMPKEMLAFLTAPPEPAKS